jgi:hypothetical protein
MLISTPATFLLKNKWKNYRAILGILFFDALTTVLTIGEREGCD